MKKVWAMRDGTKIKIKKMGISHIENCIKMLARNKERKLLQAMASGNMLQGEMAIECFDRGLESVLSGEESIDDKADEYILSFEEELRKRGVEVSVSRVEQ